MNLTPSGKGGGTKTPRSMSLYHVRGGYADTYIHFQSKCVYKYCDAYYNEPDTVLPALIHYSTVCDLVFSKALSHLKGFPQIHDIRLPGGATEPGSAISGFAPPEAIKPSGSAPPEAAKPSGSAPPESAAKQDGKLRIKMDYLGKTVHDAARSYSKQTRFQLARRLLETLVEACYNLGYNGIQHTDLKPGNLLIDNHDQFHLIDFNCMSILLPEGTWASAIGTWQYVSPEILATGNPHPSSMVWSVAMILAYWLLGTYPISTERMGRYSNITPSCSSQSQWKYLMTNIRRKYPECLQLEQRYVAELGEWWPRLSPMLRWNPHRRWSLERVIQSIYPFKIHVRNLVVPLVPMPQTIPEYIREHTLRRGHAFLKALRMESFLVQTTLLWDACYTSLVKPEGMTADLLWLCAWTIQGYLSNQFLFDNDNIVLTVYQHYHLHCDQILAHIYTVLNTCNYYAWQRDWFLYLPASLAGAASQASQVSPASLAGAAPPKSIHWERVLQVLLEQKESYTPESIAASYAGSV